MADVIGIVMGIIQNQQSIASPELLPRVVALAIGGGIVLSKFSIQIGILTVPLNVTVLFLAASAANLIAALLDPAVDFGVPATMIISLGGMISASLLILAFQCRETSGN